MKRTARWTIASGAQGAVAACAAAAALWATQALAAGAAADKAPSETVFVAEIVLLLLTGRLFGELMQRLGQPAVVGQLLAGIVLGPSVFGVIAPHAQAIVFPTEHAQKALIDGVAQLGVLLLLLLTGMETDVRLVRAVGRPAVAVSLSGIAVPLACGVAAGLFVLPDALVPEPDKRLVTALFLGTALSISSIKIVAMVIAEMNFMRRDLGQIIVASAIIDDTLGWILIAVTFGLARPGALDLVHLATSIGAVLGFLAISATVGRRAVAGVMRWTNDHCISDLMVVTAILVIMGLMALVTDEIGVHTVLGAFVAGVLVGQSPILTRRVEHEIRGLVTALFAPIFFGLAGLGTDLTVLKDPMLLALTCGLILIASLGKFGGAYLGGMLGRLTMRESLALALGMNARGSTEVIVATIGLSIGAVNHTLFTMIVTMAVVTTMAMPPTLRWALGRLPLGRDEAARLDREAFEETAFVANIERVLLARDEGASGRLAAQLGGLLSGARTMPITVMPIGRAATRETDDVTAEVSAAAAGAVAITNAGQPPADEAPDVTLRTVADAAEHDAVAAEARKGYGLLMIGIEPATTPDGGLSPRLTRLAQSFDGARAIVVARGAHREGLGDAPLRVLVPTTGTASGRRAAEVAFALAKAQGTIATVLFVDDPPITAQGGLRPRRAQSQPHRAAILADMEALARQFDVEVETIVRVAADKATAILGQARRSGDSLIVLGVQTRSSEGRPFGALAESLLESSEHSLLLLMGDGTLATAKAERPRGDAPRARSAA